MKDNNQKHFSPVIAAIIGGVAGALAVYFSDEKNRKKIESKAKKAVKESRKTGDELKEKVDRSIKSGRKTLVKKLKQFEEKIAQE